LVNANSINETVGKSRAGVVSVSSIKCVELSLKDSPSVCLCH